MVKMISRAEEEFTVFAEKYNNSWQNEGRAFLELQDQVLEHSIHEDEIVAPLTENLGNSLTGKTEVISGRGGSTCEFYTRDRCPDNDHEELRRGLSSYTGNAQAYRFRMIISRHAKFEGMMLKLAPAYSVMIPSDKFVKE